LAYPLISVVIPSYNREKTILRAVESVLLQKKDYPKIELIVVDDGSQDATEELLKPFKSDLTYILTPNNGVSAARNLGISLSKGEYIAFLDSDDMYLKGKLKAQEEYMRTHQGYLFSQCQERWIRNGVRVNPGKRHLKREGSIFLPSLHLCLISPSASIMRKEFFQEVGLFDETLPLCEDYDLWLRALIKYPVGLLDQELLIRYGGAADQLSKTPSLDKYRIRTLNKILSLPHLPKDYREEAQKVLAQKKAVYEGGLRKRGERPEEE
jgi:glycosyltransferase involved in cell wall biosynthesis